MKMFKALEKVFAEVPEGMAARVWWDPSQEATKPLEEVLDILRYQMLMGPERKPTRDDNRWKVGQRIPNIDMPGYEQHVYRLLNDPEVIYVYVDPMSPEEIAEKAEMERRKEEVAEALSRQPKEGGKSAYWMKWKG